MASNDKLDLIIQELRAIKYALEWGQSDYCDTTEAARIMAIAPRHLKVLNEKYGLPRYQRVKSYVYKRKDCYSYAALLDNRTIVI